MKAGAPRGRRALIRSEPARSDAWESFVLQGAMAKPLKMILGAERGLTDAERAALNPGLVAALARVRAEPVIVARASLLACLAGLWRGQIPVLVMHSRIYWPGALPCFAAGGRPGDLATLQHELQHVLDFRTGELTARGYAFSPRDWRYRYRLELGRDWWSYGAEQRAAMAEHLWLAENGLGQPSHGAALRLLIPWARDG